MRFGRIKAYAHKISNGEAIPVFADNKINREIDRHVSRIRRAKTKRTKNPPDASEF